MWVLRKQIHFGMATLFLLLQGTANAASLNSETLKAWDAYVQAATDRMQQRLQPGRHFLWVDEDEDRLANVRNGEPVIAPVGEHIPQKVTNGLIHDWMGAVFIPHTKMEDVLSTIRDYKRYKEFYHPGVAASKTLESEDLKDRFSVVLMNKVLVSKKALDSDCESSYYRVDDRHWYSISRSTRIQEIQNYGEEDQHKLPVDVGTGLIWRLTSITRFEERDGGVYFELEAIALSRDIPASLHWIVAPIVRRASKNSLALSLEQTENAVHPTTEAAKLPADADLFDRGFRMLTK
jgi:hypothetical protein